MLNIILNLVGITVIGVWLVVGGLAWHTTRKILKNMAKRTGQYVSNTFRTPLVDFVAIVFAPISVGLYFIVVFAANNKISGLQPEDLEIGD